MMKLLVAVAFLTLVAGSSAQLFAQQISAAPAQSFHELGTRVQAGDKLIVRDADGHTTRGRLAVLTDDQLKLEWRRFLRIRQRTFSTAAVRRVEFQDSDWNGSLIGLGIGGAVAGVGCAADQPA